MQVLACYSAAVALNWVLPANLGTFVMLLMFTTIIATATFAGVLGGMAVEKIFFTMIGTACYLYLFLTVGGSFDLQLGFINEHPWATVICSWGAWRCLFLVAQTLRARIKKWWEQAKVGGQILMHPRTFLGTGGAAAGDQLGGGAGHHRRVPGRVQHPGELPHDHARRGR